MLKNSSLLHVYQRFDKSISKTVCAFLNTNGGKILCYKNGNKFSSKDEAKTYSDRIETHLRDSISDYPESNLNYQICKSGKKYYIRVKIKKSKIKHLVFDKGEKSYYIRSGKLNKKFSFAINFNIWPIKEVKKNYFKIGNYATGGKFYKYMKIETALQCLKNENIWFVEPTMWNDKYEEFFYKASINGKVCSTDNPIIYTTCITNKRDSESAWLIYGKNNGKPSSRCVQFFINRKRLRESLLNSKYRMNETESYKKLTDDYKIFEGVVKYENEQIIDTLPNPKIMRNKNSEDNEWYHAYFDMFSFDNYMNLMLLKRDAFEHEHETRLFVVKKVFDTSLNKGKGHIDIQLPWKDIIEGVRYDANCTHDEIVELERTLKKALRLNDADPFPSEFVFKEYDVYKKDHKPAVVNSPKSPTSSKSK